MSVIVCAGLCVSPAHAQSSSEAHLVALVNGERSARGISTLAVRSDLAAIARSHSQHMAADGKISHNGSLPNQVGGGWTALAENVGEGPNVDAVHKAFMASTYHRINILDRRFNQIGVGVAVKGGTVYVTEVFARRGSAPVAVVHKPAPVHKHRAPPKLPPKPPSPKIPDRTVGVLLKILAIDAPSVDPRTGLAAGI